MEQEGGRDRIENQLQGTFVQDQTIQFGSSGDGIIALSPVNGETRCDKVVINFGNELIKGYLESRAWTSMEEMLRDAPVGPPMTLRLRRVGSDRFEDVATQGAKAVYYVNSFDGDSRHKDLRFYTRAPIAHGIWIRLEFLDGELMEGLVYNTVQFLVNHGFFLYPTDPESNNRLAYVFKDRLKDCRILGLRKVLTRKSLDRDLVGLP